MPGLSDPLNGKIGTATTSVCMGGTGLELRV